MSLITGDYSEQVDVTNSAGPAEVETVPATSNFAKNSSPPRSMSSGLLEILGERPSGADLYSFSRSLGQRVSSLMSNSSELTRWEREEATAAELSFHVSTALEKQHKLNRANLGLHGMNYALNIANVATSRKLKAALEQGQKRTEELEAEVQKANEEIVNLNTSMSHLEVQNKVYQEKAERLQTALGDNTSLLNKSLCEFRENKATYDLAIENQLRLIRSLRSGRVRQDAIVDGFLGLLSAGFVNSTLFELPVGLLLMLIPRPRIKSWLRQFIKFTTWVLMMRELRKRAVMIGWHNSVGSVIPYMKEFINYFRRAVLYHGESSLANKEDAMDSIEAQTSDIINDEGF